MNSGLIADLPFEDAYSYPAFNDKYEVIYLDHDQESDLILTGSVAINDHFYLWLQESGSLEDLKAIAPAGAIICMGKSYYYLLSA